MSLKITSPALSIECADVSELAGILESNASNRALFFPSVRAPRADVSADVESGEVQNVESAGPIEREYIRRANKGWMRCPRGMDRELRASQLLAKLPPEETGGDDTGADVESMSGDDSARLSEADVF